MTKQRAVWFNFLFIAAVMIIITVMVIKLQPYLASWLLPLVGDPLKEILSWIIMVFVIAIVLAILSIVLFFTTRKRGGGP